MKRTLQLDCSYKPVGIINANKAFSMIYGRATLVEQYDGEFLTSPSFSHPFHVWSQHTIMLRPKPSLSNVQEQISLLETLTFASIVAATQA